MSSYPIALNYKINKILNAFYANKKALANPVAEADPYDKAPPRQIRSFSQTTSDDAADAPQTARDIGTLVRGKTRLNVISALTTNDRVDFFKFSVTTAGKLAASFTTDHSIAIQLIRRDGTIIADSTATNGTKADNFQKLGTGTLEVSPGDFYLKVTRAPGESTSTKPNYAIQLSMSRYYESDYDTTETPAANTVAALGSVNSQNGQALNSVLNSLGVGNLFDSLF